MTDTANKQTVYYSPAVGGVVAGNMLGSNLYKKVPLKRALPKSLIYGGMAMGLAYPLEYRIRRARRMQQNNDITKEASYMHNNFYNKTDLDAFVKVAASRIGNIAYQVPTEVAYNALNLYEMLPEKTAATVISNLYDSVEAGMDKVAMEMIAANILEREKIASPVQALRTAYKGAKTMVGKHSGKAMTAGEIGMTGYSIKETTDYHQSKDRNPYQVGYSYKN